MTASSEQNSYTAVFSPFFIDGVRTAREPSAQRVNFKMHPPLPAGTASIIIRPLGSMSRFNS